VSITSKRRALVVGVMSALAVGALIAATAVSATASPYTARPGAVAAEAPSSPGMVRAGANSAPCFQASSPTCSSTDPLVTFTITGGDVGCTYSITVDWGNNGASTTKPVAGVAPGQVAATFTYTYVEPRTYMLSWVSTVTGGDCYGNSGPAKFTLLPSDVQKVPTTKFAGYVAGSPADGGTFKAVSALFKVPPVDCDATPAPSFAYHWVGLSDGSSVEQAGVADFCGYPRHYYAWWAMEPSDGFVLKFPVDVGDAIAASVDSLGNSRFQLQVVDFTNGRSFSETEKCTSACADTNAEVLSEGYDSSPWSGPADFSRVDYSDVRIVDSAGQEGNFDSASWRTAEYYAVRGSVLDMMPSPLADDGAAFYVEWDSDKG
jgi:hypothetical protein